MKKFNVFFIFVNRTILNVLVVTKNKQCSYHQSKNKNKQGNMAEAKHIYMSL